MLSSSIADCENAAVIYLNEEHTMWTKPAFTDLRLGFEVTLYFANR